MSVVCDNSEEYKELYMNKYIGLWEQEFQHTEFLFNILKRRILTIIKRLEDNLKKNIPHYKAWINASINEIQHSADFCIKLCCVDFIQDIVNDMNYNTAWISDQLQTLVLALLKILNDSQIIETRTRCIEVFCYFIQLYPIEIAEYIYKMLNPYLNKYWSTCLKEEIKYVTAIEVIDEGSNEKDALFELKRSILKFFIYLIAVLFIYIGRK